MQVENQNPVKARIKAGGKVSATWLHSASPVIAEIIAQSGFDVGVIDMEHGLTEVMTLVTQIQAMKNCPMVPFVRPPWNDLVMIKRILDAGAYGLVVPCVNTREEAEKAVAAIQYPLSGVRGLASSSRAARWGNLSPDYLAIANDEIFIFTQVETAESLKNVDDMLKVDRLDGIFIGPMDLSTSMGRFIDPAHEEVRKAIAEVEKKTLGAGKALGTIGANWEDAAAKYERGYNLVIYMSDCVTMGQVARERAGKFKEKYGGL
ncbi:MAG: 2,4-dihydroxyhept-2-ene-1,7-dioic acid aldolase [Planctomycetota bacterium]|jgi:2-dehydro-3-deoxyglucarate aldolase/4-hydroxy-2-oxoheptanedioate aldolase|nr:2,4-dihydroxyhept-2-ene-1,7-dioic acid aldolase [Planctomycetota bacterium]